MALNLKAKIDDVVTDDLKKKVAAWWHGVDVADLDWPDAPADADVEDMEEDAPSAGPSLDPFSADYDLPHIIVAAQAIWGKGYMTPGGSDFMDEWGQQLSLNKEKSSAFIGSRLGGQAREIAKSTGSWVTGYERIPELVEAGADLANMAGMAKNATSEFFDPDNLSLPENKFHAVLSKEEFLFVADKGLMIDEIARSLKKNGLFMFTDYVSVDGAMEGKNLEDWFGSRLGPAHLWSEQDYVSKLEAANLDIHVNEDFSHRYVDFIAQAWGRYRDIVRSIKTGEESDEEKACLLHYVADAAEQWTRIATSLGSGELQIRRFLARKIGDSE